jgi:hypothetical protein
VTESRLPLQKNHSRDVLKYKLRNGADDVEPSRERNNSRDENAKKVSPCRGIKAKESPLYGGTQFGFLRIRIKSLLLSATLIIEIRGN